MASRFLLYGANGYVGEAAARLAVAQGLEPVLAGRDRGAVEALAKELGVEARVCALDDAAALDRARAGVAVVLQCAGPFSSTAEPMVEACLRTKTHYLDITGEIAVFEALAARGSAAKNAGVMVLPGVGFDVVPTDCLAVHLHRRLPGATRLALAFQSVGPAGLPPGTQRTAIELLPFGDRIRRGGELVEPERGEKLRRVDFGQGPVDAVRFTWGDVFTAYHSTRIPDIEVYVALPPAMRSQLALMRTLRPLLSLAPVRALMKRVVQPGPSEAARAKTSTHVWGEVADAAGRTAAARLHGPEAGLVWTTRSALAAVRRVLAGDAKPGYQTPGTAFGADFVLASDGVEREDVA